MATTVLDTCSVVMDGEAHISNDFVAILSKKSGDTSIFYNTDALTLGLAIKMIAKQFVECLSHCSAEEQEEIRSILGDAFIGERTNEQD